MSALTQEDRDDVAKLSPEDAARLAVRLEQMTDTAVESGNMKTGLPWAVAMWTALTERSKQPV